MTPNLKYSIFFETFNKYFIRRLRSLTSVAFLYAVTAPQQLLLFCLFIYLFFEIREQIIVTYSKY